ncbi:MAG: EAL domain-containing protein [Ectothiorhodospiraceae bacterium]
MVTASALLIVFVIRCLQECSTAAHRSYRKLFRHSLDGMLLTTADGGVLEANPAAERILGFSADELRRGGRALVVNEDDPELRALLECRERDGSVRGRCWAQRKDGQRIRLELRSALFRDGARQLTSMSIRDVTEQAMRDYRLRLSDVVFDSASDGIGVLDSDWRVLWGNPMFEAMTGLALREAVGRTAPFFRELQEYPDKLRTVTEELERNGHWSGEMLSRRANGESYPLGGSIARVESASSGEFHYVATFRDLSQLREYERQLHYADLHDAITRLPNRFAFEEQLAERLSRADPEGEMVALFHLNIDHFKDVNESLGHASGDYCLRVIGERLESAMGQEGFVARYSGDSFFVLAAGLESVPDSALVARRLRDVFDRPIGVEGYHVALSSSIGISVFPSDGRTVGTLMRAAESALAEAKAEGGDDYRYYAAGSEARARNFISKTSEIREGLGRNEFVAYYQPVVDGEHHRTVKLEVLARWNHPKRGLVSPGEFIGAAERSGLIGELSEMLLRQAVQQLRSLDDAGFPGIDITVNLSARQFRDSALVDRLHGIVHDGGVAPGRVVLEITESLMMHNAESKRRIVQKLKQRGFRVYMDDFGTGYSSLNYLRNFAIDGVKIDRSFVTRLPGDKTDAAIVRTILAVARELDLEVVAEGIDDRRQSDYLSAQGCGMLQGFLFAKPMAGKDVINYLRAACR